MSIFSKLFGGKTDVPAEEPVAEEAPVVEEAVEAPAEPAPEVVEEPAEEAPAEEAKTE